MHYQWEANIFSEANTLKPEKTLISTFAIIRSNTSEPFFFPWLSKWHCSRIQKDTVSLHLFAWKRKTDMVDTPGVMFPKSTPLQSAYVCPSTFKHRKAIADENNFLLVLLHKKHTCRPAWEARKATLYRSPYFTNWPLLWAKWLEHCICHYAYPYQHRARACLLVFDFSDHQRLRINFFPCPHG